MRHWTVRIVIAFNPFIYAEKLQILYAQSIENI